MKNNTTNMRSWEGVKGGLYYLVQNMDQFNEFYEEFCKQKMLAVDTETNSLSWVNGLACGIVIGWGTYNNYYLPIRHQTDDPQLDINVIAPLLQKKFDDPQLSILFWNEKFDRHFLRKDGIEIKSVRHDGVIEAHLLDENKSKALKSVSKELIAKNADVWEKDLKQWRVGESKRRRKEFNLLVKEELSFRREELEAELMDTLPMEEFHALKKNQITARLKAMIRHEKANHPLALNKLNDITYDYVPLNIITPYACADVHYTYVVHAKYISAIAAHPDLRALYINECKLSNLLFEVESHGIKVDLEFLSTEIPKLEEQINNLEQEIYSDLGYEFNIESNQQLVEALKTAGCRLTKLTKKGKDILEAGGTIEDKHFSVDKETLERLAVKYIFADKILSLRKARKSLSTYVIRLIELADEHHYVHPTFNANVATGRMSCKDPNLQNQDSRSGIRAAFTVPEPVSKIGYDPATNEWVMVFIDYSQVELRLTAHRSQDPTFLAAYPWDGPSLDLHSITCANAVLGRPIEEIIAIKNDENHPEHKDIVWFRNIAKRVNFGIIYGAGPGAIQRQVSTPTRQVSREECEEYIRKYFEQYPGVKQWIDETIWALKKTGYLQNSFGRYRRLPDVSSRERWKQERAGRQGVNFLIQGDAADLFKHAAVRVGDYLKSNKTKTRIVNFVHDDIQFYWHKSELHLIPKIVEIMEDFPQITVPIKVDVEWSARDWGSKTSWKPGAIEEALGL